MATYEAYWFGAVAYAVWMVGYLVLRTVWTYELEPLATSLGGGVMATPIGWMNTVVANWVLIGCIGIFFAVLAASFMTTRRGGVPQ